jgi:hypothetical protein
MLCFVPSTCPFDTLVVTAPNTLAAQAYLVELCDRCDESCTQSSRNGVLCARIASDCIRSAISTIV